MREIKFRVWDKILCGYSKNTMGWYHSKNGIVSPETGDRYIFEQYTGLKDKNGTNEDIYEKDIMEFHAYGIHYIGVVEYHGSAFGIICRNTEVKASPFLDDAIDRHGAIKIGNIHDNPELIHDQKAEVSNE